MTIANSKKPVVIVWVATAFLVVLAALLACQVWFGKQNKFQDVTVELGTDTLGISQFMTEYALPHRVGFVSDVSAIDLGKVGTTELVLSHGTKIEKVTLTVEDTTAPEVTFRDKVVQFVDYVPDPKDFVEAVSDLSDVTCYFAEEPQVSGEYEEIPVQLVVEDASGNKTTGNSVLSYVWMKDAYALEYGQQLTKEDILCNVETDGHLVSQADIDAINASPLGTYVIVSATATRTLECVVTVQDTCGPELEVQDVQVYLYAEAELDKFVLSATDPSGVAEVRLMTELIFNEIGEQKVIIEAEDIYGNITQKQVSLFVVTDMEPPVIRGLPNMNVKKNSSPNFMGGVTATDSNDGVCAVEVNLSSLDLSKAGTYYITYTARDKSGNVAVAKRKVVVLHDEEDTKALVRSIAAGLSSNPETLRDYVRSTIRYNTNWGGNDPIWYGFTNRVGNCYVHALCLQALFNEKGIENNLIWVTDRSHYWLQVKINGVWKHIDPTPSSLHGRYSLMNDAQRYETLVSNGRNRDWNRAQWPACP